MYGEKWVSCLLYQIDYFTLCNSYIPPWGVVVLHIGVGHSPTPMCKTTPQGGIYNLLPRQHHCTREIWATFLDVAWVTGYIALYSVECPEEHGEVDHGDHSPEECIAPLNDVLAASFSHVRLHFRIMLNTLILV